MTASLNRSRSTRYRPDIDGLRALAVLAVIAYHAGVRSGSGGYVGVDVFFVISGYLIGGIIDAELRAGSFSLAAFYERRIRRIQPALLVMLAVCSALFWKLLTPVDFKRFGQSIGAALLSMSNFFFYFKHGYFQPTAEAEPLLHTWSLGIEEQYYLLFPLLALWLSRYRRGRLAVALGAALLASLALACWHEARDPTAAFYLPLGRFWELLAGALLAHLTLPAPAARPLREALALLGLASILAAVCLYSPHTAFPGATALLPVGGATLLIWCGSGDRAPPLANRLLSLAPLVFIGRISYSMYLWHWPLLAAARYALFHDLSGAPFLLYLALVLLLAYASWRWVEEPFRRRGSAPLPSRPALLGAVAAALCLGLGFAAAAHLSQGFPGRFPPQARRYAAAALDQDPRQQRCDSLAPATVRAGAACLLGQPGSARAPSFALLGDSYADALAPGFDAAARQLGVQGLDFSHLDCFPLVGVHQGVAGCARFIAAVCAYLQAHPGVHTVILAARWSSALLGTRFGQYHQDRWFITDGESRRPGYAENQRVFRRGFARLMRALAARRIVVVAYIPEQRYDVPRALALHALWGRPPTVALPLALHQERQALVRRTLEALQQHYRFSVLDVGAALCRSGYCAVQAGGRALYFDDDHLSAYGSESLERLWVTALRGPTRPRLPPTISAANAPAAAAAHAASDLVAPSAAR